MITLISCNSTNSEDDSRNEQLNVPEKYQGT